MGACEISMAVNATQSVARTVLSCLARNATNWNSRRPLLGRAARGRKKGDMRLDARLRPAIMKIIDDERVHMPVPGAAARARALEHVRVVRRQMGMNMSQFIGCNFS